jgi:Cupin-like domain
MNRSLRGSIVPQLESRLSKWHFYSSYPRRNLTTTTTSSNTNHTTATEITKRSPIDETNVTSTVAMDAGALADLVRPFVSQQRPVVLRGAAAHFDATVKWQHWDYFQQQLPQSQTGAVEMGGPYSHETSQRAEIPVHDYLTYLKMFEARHGRQGADDPWYLPTEIQTSELVYMAQNELPTPLQDDIHIPSFCDDDRYQIGLGRLYSVMWWLGPRASTSPLHFDPLDNLLLQIMGRKVIWLFSPHANADAWHYAGHGIRQQMNTSPIHPEQYDAVQFPLLEERGPPAMTCVLMPGDILYIPSKWWHYVRSVDTSASVNVWWR